MRISGVVFAAALPTVTLGACRPSDVLSVPPPAGTLGSAAVQNQAGAESVFDGAEATLFYAVDGYAANGLLQWSELLTDEFTFSGTAFGASLYANVDARVTAGGGGSFLESGDPAWKALLQARSMLVASVPGLITNEPASARSNIGLAYALAGYAELFLAESYCAGTPLSEVAPGGVVQYGMPLTTDSIVGVAVTHFDSAVAESHGDATAGGLAAVGLGRALLDRGQYAAAAGAVHNVPTTFVFSSELPLTLVQGAFTGPNIYAYGALSAGYNYRLFNVADREGGNGLGFVSAHDARLRFDTSQQIQDGTSVWYLPTKFAANLASVPLATGIEARLIEAEAALHVGDASTWLTDLNTLRNSGCTVPGVDTTCALGTGQVMGQTTGLSSLSDPGTDSGRVSLMFSERAFWLFGTGTRLGDMRRLVRQYGRDPNVVFPTGPYAATHPLQTLAPIPNYGTDVSLTLPTARGLSQFGISETNPNYKGCTMPTSAA